jgi:hypothetical protein
MKDLKGLTRKRKTTEPDGKRVHPDLPIWAVRQKNNPKIRSQDFVGIK